MLTPHERSLNFDGGISPFTVKDPDSQVPKLCFQTVEASHYKPTQNAAPKATKNAMRPTPKALTTASLLRVPIQVG